MPACPSGVRRGRRRFIVLRDCVAPTQETGKIVVANSWRFVGPHQLAKVTDCPQSISTTTITTTDAGTCSVRVADSLKEGFTEFKTPVLSKKQFGFYKQAVFSNLSCTIRNED